MGSVAAGRLGSFRRESAAVVGETPPRSHGGGTLAVRRAAGVSAPRGGTRPHP